MSLPQPGDVSRRFDVTPDGREHYRLPAYGYLEKIVLEPAGGELLPNMDASRPYVLAVALVGPDGTTIPLRVSPWCRAVVE